MDIDGMFLTFMLVDACLRVSDFEADPGLCFRLSQLIV